MWHRIRIKVSYHSNDYTNCISNKLIIIKFLIKSHNSSGMFKISLWLTKELCPKFRNDFH